ncbi:MAG: hypothetical protein ACTSRG_20540 [Candidatus Helarchaeota archaeon]
MSIEPGYIPYLITGIFCMIIIGIMCVIIINSYFKSKNKPIFFYIICFVLLELWAVLTTFYPIMGSPSEAALLVKIAITSSYVGFYSLLIFLELINFDKISAIRTVFFAIILNTFITIEIILPEVVTTDYNLGFGYLPRRNVLLLILQAIILLGIGIEYILTGYRLKNVSDTSAQRLQANMIMIGPAIGIFGVVFLQFIRMIYNYPGWLLLFVSVGMVVSGIGFIKDPSVALFLPFKVYNLMVINSAGINIFSQNFDPNKEVDDILVSSMISAITNFMEEALGVQSQLKAIIFGDRYVLLDLRKNFGVFIEAKSSSTILKVALEKFTDYFESEFSEYLIQPAKEINVFKTAINGIKDHFGFLPGIWKSN